MCEQRFPSVPQTFLSLTNVLINWFIYNVSHILFLWFFFFFSTPTLQKNRKSNWHKTPDSLYYKWTTGKSIVLLCLHAINSFAPGKQLLMIWINTLPSPRFYSPLPSVFHLSPHLPANQFTQRDIAVRIFPTFFLFFLFVLSFKYEPLWEQLLLRLSELPLETRLPRNHCDMGLFVSA